MLANAGQAGYFRTAYSPAAFGALATAFPGLATVDQVGILSDAWALGRAGVVPVTELLDLYLHLPADGDPVVWTTVLSVLRAIDTLYDGDRGRLAFRAYARRLLAPLHARLGWDAKPGEADNAAVLRESLLNTLGWLRDEGTQAEARRRFATFLGDQASLPAPVRRAALRVVAAGATPAEWDQLHALAQAARDAAEKAELYRLLGLAQDPALARRTMALSLSGEPPATTGPVMLRAVAAWHRALAFDFYAAHRAEYFRVLESDSRDRFPAQLVDGTGDAALLARLEAFMRATIPETGRGDVRRALIAGRNQGRLRAGRILEINRWLAAHPG